MRALQDMNNVDKAYLLARLFPDEREALTGVALQQVELFIQQEQAVRDMWKDTLITAEFWYDLVRSTQRIIRNQGTGLYRSARVFSDQLFDGYNAIFMIYCLIGYTQGEACPYKLKQAIHLLFGEYQLFTIAI